MKSTCFNIVALYINISVLLEYMTRYSITSAHSSGYDQRNIHISITNNTHCRSNEWNCENGQCIMRDEVCDGKANCIDRSDESFIFCGHLKCPAYLFQCTYGACVDGDAKCNGIQDCADNSDELHQQCRKKSPEFNYCQLNEFQCNNGNCIGKENVCDGKDDCHDESDETVSQCSAVLCSSYLFKCAYGACVDGDAKCNGIVDCVDESDEIPQICKKNVTTLQPRPATPNYRSCPMPRNTTCKLTIMNSNLSDDAILPFTLLHTNCNNKYKCSRCHPDGSWSESNSCSDICHRVPDLYNNLQCTLLSGAYTDCDAPFMSQTVLMVKCRNKYSMVIQCQKGRWHRPIPNCTPIKEKKRPRVTIEFNENLEITISGREYSSMSYLQNHNVNIDFGKLLLKDFEDSVVSTGDKKLNVTVLLKQDGNIYKETFLSLNGTNTKCESDKMDLDRDIVIWK